MRSLNLRTNGGPPCVPWRKGFLPEEAGSAQAPYSFNTMSMHITAAMIRMRTLASAGTSSLMVSM